MRQTVRLPSGALVIAGAGVLLAGINEWTSLGPDGGGAQSLVIDPQRSSTVYAVTSAGVFKSEDGGAHWRARPARVGSDAPPLRVTLLVPDPLVSGTLYAGTGSDGIFKSTDGGASWKAVNSGLRGIESPVFSLVVDPHNSTTLYATTASHKTYSLDW